MSSPTSRTKKYLEKLGYKVAIVEHWNPHAFIRQDMFGFIDLVAIDGKTLVWGLQVTTTGNMSSRIRKSQESPNLALWCGSGARFSVLGWSKKGGKGKRKLWEMKVVDLHPAPLSAEQAENAVPHTLELPSVDYSPD